VALALALLAGLLALAVVAAGLVVRQRLRASLPELAGERRVGGLAAAVSVERDALGVPVIRGASRADVAFATGFVHGQDRFFQMDLLRRRAAGELSEILGERALGEDESLRVHLLRARARRALERSAPDVRAVLDAYSRGANAGLESLGAAPFEYLVLRAEPRPWQPEDSMLVLLTMFARMGDPQGAMESARGVLRDTLPPALFAFLTPAGTEWDAPLAGEAFTAPGVPPAAAFDLHGRKAAALQPARPAVEPLSVARAASNSWAVAGSRTSTGGALLANDIHLDLAAPNLWYRATLAWPGHEVTGATLPGAPAIVVGSNGHVAWGVTNSVIDTTDVVLLDVDPRDPGSYRTPAGLRRFEKRTETIRLKGGGKKELPVEWTVWGPVTTDSRGRRQAVRWIAQEEGAVDFEILRLETARTLDQALDLAHRSGVPALNFVAADSAGRIGWTVIGRLPRRAGLDGLLPASWAGGTSRWQGLIPPEEVPQVVDPPSERLWTANNRLVGGQDLAKLADGGYLLGARARQIRDGLLALDRASAGDMRALQLDDRALFFQRWQALLLSALTPEAVAANPRRGELRGVVADWGGRASVDSAGFRMVRSFRILLAQDVFGSLTADCLKADPAFDYVNSFDQFEGPLWQLVTQRPAHLLDPRYKAWQEQLLASVDRLFELFPEGPLRDRTWGERNTAAIGHLFSAIPGLGRWLDMPARQLPGADYMPRVQDPSYGATLRMVVSPGREKEGFFQMPTGQSGNPLSPHYGDSQAAWVEGSPAPFLPGPPVNRLTLVPEGAR